MRIAEKTSIDESQFWAADPAAAAQALADEMPATAEDHRSAEPWSEVPEPTQDGSTVGHPAIDWVVWQARRAVSGVFGWARSLVYGVSDGANWVSGYTLRPAEPDVERPRSFPAPVRQAVRVPHLTLEGLEPRTAEHDIDHDGRFAIPDVLDATLDSSRVLSRGLSFVRDSLTVRPENELPNRTDRDEEIVRVFTDGLNTPIEVAQWRLPDYVNMTGLPMAQLTNGATSDFGPFDLPLGMEVPAHQRDWAQQAFYRTGLSHVTPRWEAIEPLTIANQELMESMRQTLFAAIDSGETLEYWVYSEATTVMGWVAQNLERDYIARNVDRDLPRSERIAQARDLRARFREGRDRITLVTTGTSWGEYRGFRTVHFYAKGTRPDWTTMALGPAEAWAPGHEPHISPRSSGHRNVFVRYPQSFPGFEAHNFQLHAPAVRATLEANGVASVVALYDQAISSDGIVEPDPERIRALQIEYDAIDNRWYPGDY
ncbi:MAG: hypothetical protein AAF654_06255 [Myxococcota bacterium]